MPRVSRPSPAMLLVYGGALLLLIGVLGVAAVYVCEGTAGEAAHPTPVGGYTPTGPVIVLSATAEAAATRLSPPTPIATAGPPASRGSAPRQVIAARVGIDAPVVEVGWRLEWKERTARGVWETVTGAAGHHRGSADPGEPGNCVLSGHSSQAGGAVFRRLGQLQPGDTVQVLTVGGEQFVYRVMSIVTLDEVGASDAEKQEHARWLEVTSEPVLTLVTCWPDWSYTHRIVVRARLQL